MDNLRQQQLDPSGGTMENEAFSFTSQRSNGTGRLVRKTSAEIVSEAKSMLAGGGTRLVSARRPITPREPRRQLYGRIAPPGRPPSAINLKYLQQGAAHALPLLEPIPTSSVVRPESVEDSCGAVVSDCTTAGRSAPPLLVSREKLPALTCAKQKATGSLENLADYQNVEHKSSMPLVNSKLASKPIKPPASENPGASSIVKTHPLKRRQVQSFDEQQVPVTIPTDHRQNVLNEDATKLLLRRGNDLLSQSSTESLLEMLKVHAGLKDCDENTVAYISAILNELYARTKGSRGSWRGAVLGALYGLVESSSPKILLSVACVVFAMNVTGSNLTGACKLVFKIARNEHNDNLFVDSDVPELLVDGLGRASPIDDPEACIYGYGAVRFLAGSLSGTPNGVQPELGDPSGASSQRSLVFRLVKHGLYQLMVLHLKIINEAAATRRLSGSPLHALFQLSGALRTLAGSLGLRNCHVSAHQHPSRESATTGGDEEQQDVAQMEQAVPLLVRAAEMCIEESEVQANIVRTLSVLSEHSECCERLADSASRLGILMGSIVQTCPTVEKGLATSNRLGYILGNVMSRWDTARVQFYCCDVSLDALLATLEYYANKTFTLRNQMGDSIVQVLTKLIRVVANMCVNGDVGYGMSKRSPLGEVLLNILLKVKEPKTAEMEELLFATLGALHNLSYYYECGETTPSTRHPGSICERLKDICGTLCSILSSEQNPARSEVARVLGNMTRTASVRQTFCEENGLKILQRCLTSTSNELLVTSCGVVVNILGDWARRATFREIEGPLILRRILQRGVTNRDWIMAGIACQAIWNYLIDTADIVQSLGQAEIDLICEKLAEGLDEDILFEGNDADNFWDDFALVGTDLLERLQLCLSGRNTPCEMSDDEAPELDGAQYW